MLHFEYSSVIKAPVEIVWNFHERKDILQILTPPWQPVQVIRRQGGLEIGAISEFCLFIFLRQKTPDKSGDECRKILSMNFKVANIKEKSRNNLEKTS